MEDNTFTLLMVVVAVFKLFTLYFALSYMKYLKLEDERLEKQSKNAAIICLAISFGVPIMSKFFI